VEAQFSLPYSQKQSYSIHPDPEQNKLIPQSRIQKPVSLLSFHLILFLPTELFHYNSPAQPYNREKR